MDVKKEAFDIDVGQVSIVVLLQRTCHVVVIFGYYSSALIQ